MFKEIADKIKIRTFTRKGKRPGAKKLTDEQKERISRGIKKSWMKRKGIEEPKETFDASKDVRMQIAESLGLPWVKKS